MRSEIRFGEADIPSPLTNALVATRLQSFPAVPLKELSAVEQERKPKDASFGERRQADSGRGTTIGMVQQVSDLCLSMFILEPPKLKQNTSCTPHLYHIKSSKRTTKFKIHKPPPQSQRLPKIGPPSQIKENYEIAATFTTGSTLQNQLFFEPHANKKCMILKSSLETFQDIQILVESCHPLGLCQLADLPHSVGKRFNRQTFLSSANERLTDQHLLVGINDVVQQAPMLRENHLIQSDKMRYSGILRICLICT